MRFVVLVLAALLPVASARAARPTPRPAATVPTSAQWAASFQVERHVLPNGLVVLMHEDRNVPTVTFWQWFKVGSRNESPGITGISHFFEHMMFNGSKNVPPKEYDRAIESNGGSSDAFTDLDMTAYYEDIASDRLDVLFRLDADRMASLSLLSEQLKSEIEVVKEERRLSTDNSIPGLLNEQLYATAFLASPYHWPTIGWMADLDRITREDCVRYFGTYYAPNNCILVLAGDFDPRVALAQIEKAFGPIPGAHAPSPPIDAEPEQRGERRAEVHYPAENVSLQVGYKAPSVTSEDLYALKALDTILSDGESSRLHRALIYEKQIALEATSSFQERLDPTLFEFSVEMRPGKTAAEGEAALGDVLERLVEQGPTERELAKAKNLLAAEFIRSLKTNNGVGQQLGFYEHLFGDYRAMFLSLDRIQALRAEDLRRVARTTFNPLHRTVSLLVPEKDATQEPTR